MLFDVIIAHTVGDYVFQGQQPARGVRGVIQHALLYTVAFLLVTRSIPALLVIFAAHALIDQVRPTTLVSEQPDQPISMELCMITLVDNLAHILVSVLAVACL